MSKPLPPLRGPKCPCGGVVPRRRHWFRWNTVHCKACGTGFELFDVATFSFHIRRLARTELAEQTKRKGKGKVKR